MQSAGALPTDFLEQLAAVLALRDDTTIEPGLSEVELRAAESAFGCPFPPDFGSYLLAFVPSGPPWPDWRRPVDVRETTFERLRTTAAFDIEQNDYWHPAWGTRPAEYAAAVNAAQAALGSAPPLLRIFAHRYLPAVPCEAANPVISFWQFVDTIHYGSDLPGYFHREFAVACPTWSRDQPRDVPFWSSVIALSDSLAP